VVKVVLPLRHGNTASSEVAVIGTFNGQYHMLRIINENSVIAACPMVLSSASFLLLSELPQFARLQLTPVDVANEVFRYQAPAKDADVALFRKLSANAGNEEAVLLSDTSLDNACAVKLIDLRRLVTGRWLNDETVNALTAIFVRETTGTDVTVDGFSSLISQKVQQIDALKSADEEARLGTHFRSFGGKSFEHLLREKVVCAESYVVK
jgi:hypothetical protein